MLTYDWPYLSLENEGPKVSLKSDLTALKFLFVKFSLYIMIKTKIVNS